MLELRIGVVFNGRNPLRAHRTFVAPEIHPGRYCFLCPPPRCQITIFARDCCGRRSGFFGSSKSLLRLLGLVNVALVQDGDETAATPSYMDLKLFQSHRCLYFFSVPRKKR